MNAVANNLPFLAQLLGLVATVSGTGFGAASLVWAYIAAGRAKGAREQAELARQAATRFGRIARLGDLIADMQELQAMLARADLPAIAGKANLLRGRVARFKTEAYTELEDDEKAGLDLARDQLQVIAEVAAVGRAKPETRIGRVQLGFGEANEALNRVVASHGRISQGE